MDLVNSTLSPHCGQTGRKGVGQQLFSNIDPCLLLNKDNVSNDYRNGGIETLVEDKYHIQYLFVQLSQIHPDRAT